VASLLHHAVPVLHVDTPALLWHVYAADCDATAATLDGLRPRNTNITGWRAFARLADSVETHRAG